MKKNLTQYILYAVAGLLLVAAAVILVVFLTKGPAAQKPPAEDLVLNQMQIVLPSDATAVEQTAAEELHKYMLSMTGVELDIVAEGSAEVASGIYIGATEFAASNQVTYPDNEFHEGWAIKAVGRNLVLTGGETRGSLYAVYHLLEDSLGVRWWNYWEEYVPMTDEARVSGDYDDSGVPFFTYRDNHPGKTATWETNVFCVHNRMNGDSTNSPIEYGGEESYGKPAHVHTFNRYFTEKDYQEHPEWFAYYNGGRISYGQMCLSNEEFAEEFTRRVLNSISESYATADAQGINRPRYFDVSPNDLPQHCTCQACYTSQQTHGRSGDLLIFVNKVAAGVAEYYPEVYIETLAYQEYTQPPLDDTKPADNVVIRLADSEMDVLHGLDHYNNDTTRENIKGWEAICAEGQLHIWDYIVFYGNSGIAPTMMKYAEDFRIMADLGVDGYMGEQENCIVTDMWDMKFWMISKLLEDPYQDEETLINDYLNGYYGDAGPYVRQYLDLVSAKADASSAFWQFSATTISPRWLKVEDVIAADDYFQQAFAAAEGDDVLLKRLRHARNALDRVIVMNFETYSEQAAEKGIAFTLNKKEICQRTVDCLTEQIAMRGDYDYDAAAILDTYKRELEALA